MDHGHRAPDRGGGGFPVALAPFLLRSWPFLESGGSGLRARHPHGPVLRLLPGTMSRTYKIALILKSKSSLPVYKDLAKLSDRELDEQVHALISRMRANESPVIARMVLRQPTFSLN